MGKRVQKRRGHGPGFLLGILLMTGLLLTPMVSAGAAERETGYASRMDIEAPTERETTDQASAFEPETVQPPEGAAPTEEPAVEPKELRTAAPIEATEPEEPPEGPVDASYFEDAVFLGDSRTEGFHLYSGLETGQYLYAVGATVESVFTKATEETDDGIVPMLDALDGLDFSKVYIMLGVNELGWPKTEKFYDQYGKIVDRIRESHPDAKIVLQSILPVSAKQEAKGSYVNNGRIAVYNEIIRQLAEEKDCTYLNVAEVVTGEDGCLPADQTSDGIHLNIAGCKTWLAYLQEHPV